MTLRVAAAAWLAENRWFPSWSRWAEGLVRDLEAADPKQFHKFVWEHHLDRYGQAYEATDLIGSQKLNSTARAYEAFVEDLEATLDELGGKASVGSVLDVGCSAGHVLRSLETEVLPAASRLVGVDIDRHATESGRAQLAKLGSKAQLIHGDLETLELVLGPERFDFTFAAGSLSYLDEQDARRAVAGILRRTNRLVALIGLAHSEGPNSGLADSLFREGLGSMWTHNFAAMIEGAHWRVVRSRWEPPGDGDNQGLYFVFASPS